MFVYFKQRSIQTWLKSSPQGASVQPAGGSAEPLRFAPGSPEDGTHRLLPQCPLMPRHLLPPSLSHLSLSQEMPSSMALDLWSSKSEKPPICYILSDPEPLYYWHHLAGLEPPLKAQGLLDRELLSVTMFQWKMGSKWQFLRCSPGRFHRCAMLNSVPRGFQFEESIKHKR